MHEFAFDDEYFDRRGDIFCEETFNTSNKLFNLKNDGNDALNRDVNIEAKVVGSKCEHDCDEDCKCEHDCDEEGL